MWGEETPKRIDPNFILVEDIHDVMTHARFGDNRLRDHGWLRGQSSAFPTDFAGRPYNSHTTV